MRKANINLKGLRKEIAKKGFPAFKAAAVPRIEKKLQQQVGNLLAAFEEHPVTKEIDAGPGSNNSSGTLGGYGNLFTFIGFERGQDPISPIRSLLAKSIKVVSIRKKRNVLGLTLKFTVPTEEEIAAVSPLPWATGSWVEAVERGMSGVGRYLYSKNTGRFTTSRSGQAIEASVDVRGSGSSTPVTYITGLLAKMLKDIERSLKTL
jgi:hypothetical protein